MDWGRRRNRWFSKTGQIRSKADTATRAPREKPVRTGQNRTPIARRVEGGARRDLSRSGHFQTIPDTAASGCDSNRVVGVRPLASCQCHDRNRDPRKTKSPPARTIPDISGHRDGEGWSVEDRGKEDLSGSGQFQTFPDPREALIACSPETVRPADRAAAAGRDDAAPRARLPSIPARGDLARRKLLRMAKHEHLAVGARHTIDASRTFFDRVGWRENLAASDEMIGSHEATALTSGDS